jgi:flagellar protein FlaG
LPTPSKPVKQAAGPRDRQPLKRADLEKAVTDIREFVQSTQRKLDFSIDDSTGVVVVKVIATDSGEVIRQLPSETALKLAQNLSDAQQPVISDKCVRWHELCCLLPALLVKVRKPIKRQPTDKEIYRWPVQRLPASGSGV